MLLPEIGVATVLSPFHETRFVVEEYVEPVLLTTQNKSLTPCGSSISFEFKALTDET